ncbi:hypothetical protein EVAR_87348_1 [Eumeta japonica]|uniref:Uncharacterized protein n=1 Tax=Eumeta variegata TaxID=151549 RepID=A0A4C1YWA5_EUMVA|nr:hypothetical protein EVAR_87348_1 [Eumeta japonica]
MALLFFSTRVNEPDRDLADLSMAEVAELAESDSDSPSEPTTVLSEHVSSSSDDEERAFLLFFPLEGDCDLLEFWLEGEEAVLLEARDLANTFFIKARVRGPFEIPPATGGQEGWTHLTVRLTAGDRRRTCLMTVYCSPARTIGDAARPAGFPGLGRQGVRGFRPSGPSSSDSELGLQ